LTEFSVERVEIIVPITEQVNQQYGTVHGGVISYAADNALTFAGGSVLGPAVASVVGGKSSSRDFPSVHQHHSQSAVKVKLS
jgi:acyl-coenzyme A thioesterase PaaI-like protein